MSDLTLSINVWVHAHFETGKPVEADVQTFFGEFDIGLIEFMQKRESVDLLECLESLPTEDWLHVDIVATVDLIDGLVRTFKWFEREYEGDKSKSK